ncbi:hypothetical protein DITRI_Ditri03aG0070300 [Diplodiscus trichospermus]
MKQRGKEKVNDSFAVSRTSTFYMHNNRFGVRGRHSRDQRRTENTQGSISKTDSAKNKQQHKRSLQKTANADSERALSAKEKQPAKPFEMTGDTDSSTVFSRKSKQPWNLGMASYTGPASVSFHGVNVDCHSLPLDQHLSSPSMRSYQQAIFPATSFHHDNLVKQKRMVQTGSRNAVFPALPPNQIIHVTQANKILQGNISLDISYAKEAQPIAQQMPVDSTIQPPSEVFSQQFHSRLQNESQNLFEASSLSLCEPGTFADKNFNATPKLFPVMQFGGLHHGSLGGPAIDMTSTGYSGESQVHLRNPNLTWLPILPAAAGAMGATYHHPCVAPDGSCYGNLTATPFIDISRLVAMNYYSLLSLISLH